MVEMEESIRGIEVLGAQTQPNLIILNLVNNAAKFTEKGKIVISVAGKEETKDCSRTW